MPPSTDLTRPTRDALRAVIALHALESVAQALGLLVAPRWPGIDLATGPLWTIVGVYALWNAGSAWALARGWLLPVTATAVFAQLLAEVVALTALLYFSGGASNPFVSLYLIPIALGATILSFRYTLALAGLSISAYAVLLRFYVPIPELEMGHVHGGVNLHLVGMWANLVISAIIVLVLLTLLARTSRQRAEQLARLREEAVRNEQIVAMGSIAAATAHSLSTPLSTVQVLLEELAEDLDQAERRENAELARQQIELCRNHLTGLLAAGGIARLDAASREPPGTFLDRVLADWLTTRPDAELERDIDPALRSVPAVIDPTLWHSLVNLLNNAADANAERGATMVGCTARREGSFLVVTIDDQGPGPPRDLDAVGFASTKPRGLGVGLLLTQASLDRLGGSLELRDRRPGCRAVLRIPLFDGGAYP
jgi:two-component system sensor histidine kinase RegB